MENKAYISLGTNLGDREKNLQIAKEEIREFAKITDESKIYETPPYGYKNQGDFLNMAIKIKTELTPLELIFRLQEIEHKMGRVREIKNGPRIIDLDILLFEDLIIEEQNLKIPHPHLHKRDFVLKPLKDIAAEEIHPKLNETILKIYQKNESKRIS